MATINVETPAQSALAIGEDRLVELKLLHPGIVIGLWKVNISKQDDNFQIFTHSL